MKIRKTACLCACGGIAFVGAFVGVQMLIYAANAEQIQLRAMVPELSYEPGSGVFSEAHDTDMMRLYNDVGRELEWSAADREWVSEIIGSGWPDIQVDPQSDMYEAWSLYSATLTVVGERIGFGIQTDPEIAQLYRESVVLMLDHPQGRVRQKAATAIALAGMLGDPAMIAALERMAEHDPHEGAARAASVKLRQHAGIETDLDDCPTCPGRTP